MFGFYNVRKPPGPTSHDIVAAVRRRLGRGVKVGHAGTLDPFAEGVLVLCIGPATRLASYVQARPKRYVAQVTLGATSATDDPQGPVAETAGARPPEAADVRRVLEEFRGRIEQVPPAHSAVHVDGRRAYELARAGRDVELPPRRVVIHAIELLRYAYPALEIDVTCGSGTYIRSLARDVGRRLGVGGYCSRLERTRVADFRVEDAASPDALEPEADLVPPPVALRWLPRVRADGAEARRIAMGQAVRIDPRRLEGEASAPARGRLDVAVIGPEGNLLAIAAVAPDEGVLKPAKVFASR